MDDKLLERTSRIVDIDGNVIRRVADGDIKFSCIFGKMEHYFMYTIRSRTCLEEASGLTICHEVKYLQKSPALKDGAVFLFI